MSGLKLETCTDRAEYSAGEEILARVLLFNLDEDPVTVNSRLALGPPDGPGEVQFSVRGPSGGELPFAARVNLGLPEEEDFTEVVPWNCVGRQYELRTYYRFDEPGRYELRATYRTDAPDAWAGVLHADPTSFTVL